MKKLTFYEKPGCKGNARQKTMLEEKGFGLEVKSTLDEAWSKESLRPFFDKRSVPEWFNMTAPAIKQGQVNPGALDEEGALEAMIKDPLLIRRPLIEYNGKKSCGFDDFVLSEILGVEEADNDLEQCHSVTSEERCD
jgi:nitrogenase-associated protein